MSGRRAIATLLVASLLALDLPAASADVTSSEAGQRFFIHVVRTTEGAFGEDSRIRFEECEVAAPDRCDAIGSRDYSVRELRAERDRILAEARQAGGIGVGGVLEVILGVLVGMAAGAITGGLVGAYILPVPAGQEWGQLSAIGEGMLGGILIVGTLGGILAYKWIKKRRSRKAAALRARALGLDDRILEGEPVTVASDIDSFARDLGDLLDGLGPETLAAPAAAGSYGAVLP